MYDNGDGTYTVEFTDYVSGDYEVQDKCYNFTPEKATATASKLKSGTAIVKSYKYNGNNTYRLISLKY